MYFLAVLALVMFWRRQEDAMDGDDRPALVHLSWAPGHYLRADAARAATAAVQESDVPIVRSSFRTRRQQELLYENYLRGGPLAAPPGKSKHEVGLALDARGTKAWEVAMEKHGWRRTVASEPWHWEYSA